MFHYIVSPTLEMRKEATSQSEVVSQALFSEEIKVLESSNDWIKIETLIDHYSGWVRKEGIHSRDIPFTIENRSVMLRVNRLSAHVYDQQETIYGPILTLPFESRMICHNFEDDQSRWLLVELPDSRLVYVQRGDVSLVNSSKNPAEITQFSRSFLGIPYTWGGRSSFGYDCSGFVQMLYRQMGIFLPRDSQDQFNHHGFVDCHFHDLSAGDLLFFGFSANQIRHVGVFLGEGQFIHTSAVVENQPYVRVSHLKDFAWSESGYYPFLSARKWSPLARELL